MNRRYTKAILIGTAIGVCALAYEAASPVPPSLPLTSFELVPVPFWDLSSGTIFKCSRPDLLIAALFLRFCIMSLEQGYYFLLVPICLACIMARLGEINDENCLATSFRRAIKSTGLILLCLWLWFASSFALVILLGSGSLLISPLEELMLLLCSAPLMILMSLIEGLKFSILFGIAEVIFLMSFAWQIYHAEYRKADAIVKAHSNLFDQF